MKIHNIDATGSFTYNGVDLSNLTGSTSDSGSFSTQILNLNQVSSSLNSFTSSINTTIKSKLDSESVISGSIQVSIADTTGYSTFSSSVSSSIGYLSGSVATTTLGLSSSIGSLSSSVATTTSDLSSSIGGLSSSVATNTSGLAGRITTIEGRYATTGSNIFVGSQVITGSLYITNDMVVQGCSCLQNITASAVSIGTNTVVLNTATPAVRFAGISVQDSGSNAGVTGSIYWDGLCNRWIYSNPSDIGYSGGMLLSGPRTSTLGSESPLTCNYIAKSGGGDHLYDSNIIDDGTTVCVNATLKASGQVCGLMGTFSCVGIGCTSPNYPLDIKGTAGTIARITDGTSHITFYAGSGLNEIATVSPMLLTVNGTERLRITSTGISCFACQVCVPNIISTGASGGRYGTFSAPANGGYITFDAGGTAFGDIGSYCAQYGTGDATTLLLGSRTGYALALGTNSTERLRITACGKIGIGTSNPCSELTVIGNVKAGYAPNVGLIIGLSPVGVPNNDLNSYVLWGDAASFGGNNGDLIYIPRSSTSADHRFYTANAGLATEKVRFTYDGKVGIGSTNPQQKLEVKGSIRLDSRSKVDSGEIDNITFTKDRPDASTGTYEMGAIRSFTYGGYAGGLTFYSGRHTGNGNYGLIPIMTIGSTSDIGVENMGIGTTSPSAKLHVVSCTTHIKLSYGNDADCRYLTMTHGGVSAVATDGANNWYSISMSGGGNGSNAWGGGIQFLTNNISRGYFAKAGEFVVNRNVLVGLEYSSTQYLAISENQIYRTGNGTFYLNNSGTGDVVINQYGGGTYVNGTNGYGRAVTNSSDQRLKKNITSIDNGLEKVLQMNGVYFEFNKQNELNVNVPEGKRIGLIAQEIENIIPEAVFTSTNENEPKTVDYMGLSGLMVKAIQEQQCIICSQSSMINILKTCLGIM